MQPNVIKITDYLKQIMPNVVIPEAPSRQDILNEIGLILAQRDTEELEMILDILTEYYGS